VAERFTRRTMNWVGTFWSILWSVDVV